MFEPLTVVERRCLELAPGQEGMRDWLQDSSVTIYAPCAVCAVSRYPFVTVRPVTEVVVMGLSVMQMGIMWFMRWLVLGWNS